ncbi:hypothetical protein VTO42DRAFT_59 [Malbranchea cinnamomea]
MAHSNRALEGQTLLSPVEPPMPISNPDQDCESSNGAAERDSTEPKSGLMEAHDQQHQGEHGNEHAFRLRHFMLRSLFLVTGPPLVAAYFVVTQTVLFSPDPDIMPFGHRNATWVFYSWFLIGVFGIGAAKYGLEGVEAAMLQEPFWAPRNAKVLFMHSEKSWSGMSGWLTVVGALLKPKTQQRKVVGRLWLLLATLSLIVTVGLALSGLAMELFDGYVKASGHPKVIGRTFTNFRVRKLDSEFPRARSSWLTGVPTTLPGAGILYTSPGTDRSVNQSLASLPNSLPEEGGHLDIFVAPQGANPVQGNAWGLRLGYRCDLVESISDFTVLSQRFSDLYSFDEFKDDFLGNTAKPSLDGDFDESTFLTPDNETIITFWNGGNPPYAGNIWAYGETGHTPHTMMSSTYFWRNASTFDEEGLRTHGAVYEVALWQVRRTIAYEGLDDIAYEFNETVSPSIADFGSPFLLDQNNRLAFNDSFFPSRLVSDAFNLTAVANPTINTSLTVENILSIAQPIGVRCLYQYAPGYADLNPNSATFTNFQQTPPPPPSSTSMTPPFGVMALRMLDRTFYDLFVGANAPPPVAYSNSEYYTYFLQPQLLLRGVMRAFAMDLLQLMYDGVGDIESGYEHENLTTTKPGKIIGPGAVPPLVPAILLCIWAAGCVVLGAMYGFKRRWADTLNGFSMFCAGADYSDQVRDRAAAGFGIHRDFLKSEGLNRIPGMIGDACGNEKIGHVTLVERKKSYAVRRDKFYH